MNKFCSARVVDKALLARDAFALTLEVPDERSAEFRYRQGQHLPMRATIEGEEVRRTYSICSPVADNRLRVGIRVQDGGRFSTYVAEKIQVGDHIDIMPPSGQFHTPLNPEQRKVYAAFVAGSGITPILSILATTLATEPHSEFVLFYGNRQRATTMFCDALWALKNRFPERLSLHFLMSQQDNDIALYEGRLDAPKVRALVNAFLSSRRPDDIFICGPNPMIDTVTAELESLGFNRTRIHSERFRALSFDDGTTPAKPSPHASALGTKVTVTIDGRRESFTMSESDDYLLDAARAHGIDLPYSCKAGVCSTCRTRLAKGRVEMDNNDALEAWEVERGFILACQARPLTGDIELDYDTA
ncbi:MAG: 2Fe-2S iron-sulfur cluster-binding protein [Gammaproteobacteria bacterium]